MKLIFYSVVVFLLILSTPYASAQEYFGVFLDKLQGVFVSEAKPRPKLKLESDFRFEDPNKLLWIAPKGIEVDGASIPKFFWSIIGGPFEGAYINASVIHDHFCHTKERTAHDTHRNFYYGMRASDVPEWKAKLMYWAVSTFGPSWRLEKRVFMRQTCNVLLDKTMSCKSVPSSELTLVEVPPVDLTDPDVLVAAISKTNAVARTLLTSKGEFLDISPTGPVKATDESIIMSSNSYRDVFLSKDFISTKSRLGVLSQTTGGNLRNIVPWSNNRVPNYSEVATLTPKTSIDIHENKPFVIDKRSKDLLSERFDFKALESKMEIGSYQK